MARKTKKIHSPSPNSLGGWVCQSLAQHPKGAALGKLLSAWVKNAQQVDAAFAQAVSMYEIALRDLGKLASDAKERSDLDNIESSAKDLLSRLENFPQRARATLFLRMSKVSLDSEGTLERLQIDLRSLHAWVGKIKPSAKLKPGNRPASRNSDARKELERSLGMILKSHARIGLNGDAAVMAQEVDDLLNAK